MTGAVPLARRNLLGQRARFVMSVGGVGLALLLILALDAVFAGVQRQITAYATHTGAGAIISQAGVTTMHMSNSALPLALAAQVRRDPAVARVEPILYSSLILDGRKPTVSYLIGYRGGGGPWKRVAGAARPGPGGIILDTIAAERLGVGVGDRLRVAGRRLRVAGLTSGTTSIISAVSFVEFATLAEAARTRAGASYMLVWPRRGVSDDRLAGSLTRRIPQATVQTLSQFARAERSLVNDMSTDLIRGLTLIGFVVGVAVAGLSSYTTTSFRLREYAVLRAIGMSARSLYALVLRQALLTVALGLSFGLTMLGVLMLIVPRLSPTVTLVLTAPNLARAAAITAVIGMLASLFPVHRLTRVEPASVYTSA